jgi:hypothetical protein
VSMSVSLEFFCGVWSQKSEHEAISVTISGPEGSSRSEWILGVMASRCGNVLLSMMRLSLVLTNRNAYIQCEGDELCSSPDNW